MALIATYPQEPVFEAAALEIRFEFPVDMVGQKFTLLGQLVDQRRVVRFDELVEKCLLGLMPFVGNVAKALPALCQHAVSRKPMILSSSLWQL